MKKKTVVLALVLGVMVNAGVFAQGYPVIDMTAIVAAIENGYTMAENLQAMYTNIRTSYDQLQQQIRSFEMFDLSQLDATDPLGSWNSINTYADRMMTYGQNIEAIINKKDIRIGNISFSLADIFMSPNNALQNLGINGLTNPIDGLNNPFDPFELMLSLPEREAFLRKFGRSFGNHMRITQLGDMLRNKATEVVGYVTNLQRNIGEDRERLGSIVGNLFGSESIIQQQQINNAVMSIMAQDVKTQAQLLGDVVQQLATNFSQAQVIREAIENEININDLDISEGLLRMIGEMEPPNLFR